MLTIETYTLKPIGSVRETKTAESIRQSFSCCIVSHKIQICHTELRAYDLQCTVTIYLGYNFTIYLNKKIISLTN